MADTAASSHEDSFDISQVAGNAPDNIKRMLGRPQTFFSSFVKAGHKRPNVFGRSIEERMVVKELSILNKEDEPEKLEGRAVLEVDVTEDMVNGGGTMHGGCSAFLIDMASSFALAALDMYQNDKLHGSVSQALNVVYHSPAEIGERLRLVNTTLTMGSRVESVRTEIWNATRHRLVASGIHIKMAPSPPPKAAL
ncbi:HotDog domain-containing protein [Crassisporium funariophilum]|nr:HotDog domain-containing protein [Crassisporium funariophilum]